MNEDGTMAKGQDLFDFAKKHKLKIGKIDDLIAYRLKIEKFIKIKKSDKIIIKNQLYKIKNIRLSHFQFDIANTLDIRLNKPKDN